MYSDEDVAEGYARDLLAGLREAQQYASGNRKPSLDELDAFWAEPPAAQRPTPSPVAHVRRGRSRRG